MQWREFLPHVRHFSQRDQKTIEKAFALGKKKHDGQLRKSGEPYFTHPIAVAEMLAGMGADRDTIMAALLHDTIEDTDLTLEEIDAQCNGDVRTLVEGVTKLTVADLTDPNTNEQVETLRKMFTLMEKDMRIMVIKLVDRLHNMRTTSFLPEQKRQALAKESLDVYVKIADKLCMKDLRDELEGLCLAILEPAAYEQLHHLLEENKRRGGVIIKNMRATLNNLRHPIENDVVMHYEQKSWRKLREQLSAGGTVVTGISDIIVAFVCSDLNVCYQAMGVLHQMWKRETMSFQDFINAPSMNGYRGLHTTVILEDGIRIRCKIRTNEMHEYARKGVASICFRDHPSQVLLPWTERISPLSKDTRNRSDEFLRSLQKDILGESIVIHGPDDQTVLVPKGSTALDGAFYLFGDEALRLTSIRIGGKETPLNTPLDHAMSLNIMLGNEQTAERSWLDKVRTGLATAAIRSALVKEKSDDEKLPIGKELLQSFLLRRGKGFLEEFDHDTLSALLRSLGYPSLQNLYIGIADGRVDPYSVYSAVFESKRVLPPAQSIITFAIEGSSLNRIEQVFKLPERFGTMIKPVRLSFNPLLQFAKVKATLTLTSIQQPLLLQELRFAGARNIRITSVRALRMHFLAAAILTMLWGMDPVLAKIILNAGVAPLSFAFIRALSIFAFSLFVLLITQSTHIFLRIPFKHVSLWIAGASFFVINIFTYLALQAGSPLLYNTVLRGNAAILAIPMFIKSRSYANLLITVILTILGYALIVSNSSLIDAFLLSLITLLFFSIYTISSKQFQFHAQVIARYPQFFFFTSVVGAIAAFLMPLFVHVPMPSAPMIALVSLYCVSFIGIPYILFYTLTQKIGYASISPWINVSLLVTLVFQVWLLGIEHLPTLILAALPLLAGSILASQSVNRAAPTE